MVAKIRAGTDMMSLCVFGLILRPITQGIGLLLCSISANQNICIKKDDNQEVNNEP